MLTAIHYWYILARIPCLEKFHSTISEHLCVCERAQSSIIITHIGLVEITWTFSVLLDSGAWITYRPTAATWSLEAAIAGEKDFLCFQLQHPPLSNAASFHKKEMFGGSVADFNWKGTVVRLQLKLSWSWSRLEEDLKKCFYFTLRTFTFSQCSLSLSPQINWLTELNWWSFEVKIRSMHKLHKCPHLTFSQVWAVASFDWFLLNLTWVEAVHIKVAFSVSVFRLLKIGCLPSLV